MSGERRRPIRSTRFTGQGAILRSAPLTGHSIGLHAGTAPCACRSARWAKQKWPSQPFVAVPSNEAGGNVWVSSACNGPGGSLRLAATTRLREPSDGLRQEPAACGRTNILKGRQTGDPSVAKGDAAAVCCCAKTRLDDVHHVLDVFKDRARADQQSLKGAIATGARSQQRDDAAGRRRRRVGGRSVSDSRRVSGHRRDAGAVAKRAASGHRGPNAADVRPLWHITRHGRHLPAADRRKHQRKLGCWLFGARASSWIPKCWLACMFSLRAPAEPPLTRVPTP